MIGVDTLNFINIWIYKYKFWKVSDEPLDWYLAYVLNQIYFACWL